MAKALNILKNLIKETENDRKWFSKLRKSLIEKFKCQLNFRTLKYRVNLNKRF